MMLPPGSTIGILGGGQLGRMLCVAAAQLGYRTHVLAPDAESVAAQTASSFTREDYHSRIALDDFAARADVVTYEFENIAIAPVEYLATRVPVYPGPLSLSIAQDRAVEKAFVVDLPDARTAPWRKVTTVEELRAAAADIGTPAILKTLRLGYDGKGQVRLRDPGDVDAAWDAIGARPAILEGVVDFTHEFSVILVRGLDGAVRSWPQSWNEHRDGILWRSSLPAPPEVAVHGPAALALATRIADKLGHVGVLTCEFFATPAGPVFNEMAPRVHNSGHWTIEGAVTSQFENHIRAVCGLPLGDTHLTGDGIEMTNLIGHDADRWADILADAGAHLHLYGKDARPGRKMGHVTRVN